MANSAALKADGAAATIWTGMRAGGGSGGGAGGSIHLQVNHIDIDDSTHISANGGDGVEPGGGGGGAGLVHLEPLPGSPRWPTALPISLLIGWSPLISSHGGSGKGGVHPWEEGADEEPVQSTGSDGGSVLFTGFNCSAGLEGPLCRECELGTMKPDVGVHNCSWCPEGSFSSHKGASVCDVCAVGKV